MSIEFLDFADAFPTLNHRQREVGISRRAADGGCAWEFMVTEVCHGDGRSLIGIQVRIFDDAWVAFSDIPDFFSGLNALTTEGARAGLQDVKELCADLGYIDRTADYTSRHEHSFQCSCGAKP